MYVPVQFMYYVTTDKTQASRRTEQKISFCYLIWAVVSTVCSLSFFLSLSESFCINFHNIVLSCIRKKRDNGKGNVDGNREKNDFMLLFFIFLISFSLVVFLSFIFMIPFHCSLARHRYNELNVKTLNSSCCYI